MYRFLLKKRYWDLLSFMYRGERTLKECEDFTGMQYGHLFRVFREWQDKNIISRSDVGGKPYVFVLTDRGERMVVLWEKLDKVFRIKGGVL